MEIRHRKFHNTERTSKALLTLSRRVRILREKRGLTRGALATAVGVVTTSITNIESGRQCPSLPMLLRLCDELEVPICEVLK